MDEWLTFWTFLLIAGLALFGGLTVVVACGGFFDVREMLRSVEKQHEDETGPDGS